MVLSPCLMTLYFFRLMPVCMPEIAPKGKCRTFSYSSKYVFYMMEFCPHFKNKGWSYIRWSFIQWGYVWLDFLRMEFCDGFFLTISFSLLTIESIGLIIFHLSYWQENLCGSSRVAFIQNHSIQVHVNTLRIISHTYYDWKSHGRMLKFKQTKENWNDVNMCKLKPNSNFYMCKVMHCLV